jgi:arginyl-tRNA synthetase
VVVDFSSPNIAKEMHVGHLRSTIIGEATCRVLEFSGHEVHRLNHLGDWGTQFGMLIEYMKETFPNFETELPDVSDLQEFYKSAKKRFDDDAEFKTRAQKAVVSLQAGDKFARNAWQRICDVSRKAFQIIYDRLDIVIEERGESWYNEMIPGIVEQLQQQGICKESDGAQCVFTPRVCAIPLMAVKSDGGYGYDSTDLAAIHHRLLVMKADWIVYITDLGQEQHFHMIFDAAEQAGWHKPGVSRCDHMGFGVIQGEDKKKFKTRSGEVVKLNDLLDEAQARALEEIEKRCTEQEAKGEALLKTEEERRNAATNLGTAAVRYFDMKQNRNSPYVFNYDRMLDPKGNTAVYLYYAYARLLAIQRKAGMDDIPASELKIVTPEEHELAKKLCEFPDVIESILGQLHLHFLTDYLYQLCGVLTTFITKCRVIDSEEQRSRLCLLEASRRILHKSFFLLGFTPLERI